MDSHVSFAQVQLADPTHLVEGTDGNAHADVVCFKCMKGGHIARHCPSRVRSGGVQNVQVTLTHSDSAIFPRDLILIDSGSTISSVCNIELIDSVHDSPNPVRVYTNGGFQDYDKQGKLRLFDFEVLYNPLSLANILSLSEVAEKYRITMDTSASASIRVHLDTDRVLIFEQCGSGLYFFDTSDMDKTKQSVSN